MTTLKNVTIHAIYMVLLFVNAARYVASFIPAHFTTVCTYHGRAFAMSMSSYKGPRGPPGGKERREPSPSSSTSTRSSSSSRGEYIKKSKPVTPNPDTGVRINKCLGSLSRRAADDAISEGRVTVNGQAATSGQRVNAGDKVMLDGKLQRWESTARAKTMEPAKVLENRNFVYLKYWKPTGVTCTNDPRDPTNIITAGRFDLFPQRMFTVGRLDKVTILLTILLTILMTILPRTRLASYC